ncbi:MAG: chromate transporter [Clostridia bacterium]|nr:chromate transporter [Clostridia bacterium]
MKELAELFKSFFMIGAFTFGGGYAMLPMLEKEVVTKHKWATMEEISNYFAIGQCTPGIIAVNTATFVGYKQKKNIGGIIATLGVVTPSVIIILVLAGILDIIFEYQIVKSAFAGISVAVCALLVQALWKLAKSGVKDVYTAIVALMSAIVSVFLKLSPILIVVVTAIVTVCYKYIQSRVKGVNKQ